MRYFTRLGFLIILFIASSSISFSEEKKVVVYTAPSTWQESSPVSANEPVPALGDGEEKLVTEKMDDKTIKQLVDSFVERAEKTYTEKYTAPEGFLEWLKENPQLRSTFWLAINPYYDDIGKAMEVLNKLRKADAKSVERFYHLAVAFAVVWDTPDAIQSSRYSSIWKMTSEQFEVLPNYLDNFKCFTNPEHLSLLNISPDKLTWPILVQVVDMDLSPEEIEWGFRNYRNRGKNVYSLYDSIKYDYGKAGGETPKLGDNKYNLQNLLKFGGICGDQAHFASRMAKLFGTPAMKVEGTGRYGEGHAWLGYLNLKNNRLELDFTGRYFFDYYYTGEIFDPQTRTKILDSDLAMLYEGINADYNKYINSLMLTRMAEGLILDKPEVSLKRATNALQQNMYYAPAWLVIMKHIKNGTLNPSEGITWLNKMTTTLKKYPDIIMASLVDFMDCIPKNDSKKRDSNYQMVSQIFKNAKRPDLSIRLNLVWGEELCVRGEEAKVMTMYLDCAQSNAGEGNLILPLLKRANEISRKLNKNKETIVIYEKIIQKIPHYRNDKLSKSYQDTAQLLVYLYNDLSMGDKASKLTKLAQLGNVVQVTGVIDNINKKKPEKTIAEFSEIIKQDSKSSLMYNERGEAYRLKGEVDKAVKDFDEAIKMNPKLDAAYENRADLYSTVGDFEKAIADYNEAIKLNPKNAVIYHNRGFAYCCRGEIDKGIDDFNEAIKINQQYSLAYFNRGGAYYSRGQLDKALTDYTETIKLNPKYSLAYFNRGTIYQDSGKITDALADYNEAINLNPADYKPYNNRGTLYCIMGRMNEASKDYIEAIRLNPKSDCAYGNLGFFHHNKKEYDKAINNYNEAIKINQTNFQLFINRGISYDAKGELDKAAHDYTEAIRLNPKNEWGYNNRGWVYYRRGELDKAIDDYNEAIKVTPKNSDVYANRGWAYYKKGIFDKGIEDYNEAIKLKPRSAMLFGDRGTIYMDKGDYEKALADLECSLRLDPNYSNQPYAPNVRENLEKCRKKLRK
jgi:tetratricopeptide (TPR) repeat protein